MKFTSKELNANELIASNGTDIPTAERVIQLQLRASGCERPIVVSPDMYEQRGDYTFNLQSDNCIVIPKPSKCGQKYSPRNMKANPNSSGDVIVGADKYIVCIKSSSDASKGNKQFNGAK